MKDVNKARISQKVAKASSPREQSCQARQHHIVHAKTRGVNTNTQALPSSSGLGTTSMAACCPPNSSATIFCPTSRFVIASFLGKTSSVGFVRE